MRTRFERTTAQRQIYGGAIAREAATVKWTSALSRMFQWQSGEAFSPACRSFQNRLEKNPLFIERL